MEIGMKLASSNISFLISPNSYSIALCPSQYDGEDRLLWANSQDGNFTVKIVHQLLAGHTHHSPNV